MPFDSHTTMSCVASTLKIVIGLISAAWQLIDRWKDVLQYVVKTKLYSSSKNTSINACTAKQMCRDWLMLDELWVSLSSSFDLVRTRGCAATTPPGSRLYTASQMAAHSAAWGRSLATGRCRPSAPKSQRGNREASVSVFLSCHIFQKKASQNYILTAYYITFSQNKLILRKFGIQYNCDLQVF